MASPHAALWRLYLSPTMPAPAGPGIAPASAALVHNAADCKRWDAPPSSGRAASLVVSETRCVWPVHPTTYFGQQASPARPNGTIAMHPGASNEHPQLQWTAPAAGRVTIAGLVYPVDLTANHNAGFNVFHNSALLVRVVSLTAALPFAVAANVSAGDVITFGVDWGSNRVYTYDETGWDAAINYASLTEAPAPSPSPTPPPIPLPVEVITGVGVGAVAIVVFAVLVSLFLRRRTSASFMGKSKPALDRDTPPALAPVVAPAVWPAVVPAAVPTVWASVGPSVGPTAAMTPAVWGPAAFSSPTAAAAYDVYHPHAASAVSMHDMAVGTKSNPWRV